jgi:hypothetical protein
MWGPTVAGKRHRLKFGVTRLYYHPTKGDYLVVQVYSTWYEFSASLTDTHGWHRRAPYVGRRDRLEQLTEAVGREARSLHRIPLR